MTIKYYFYIHQHKILSFIFSIFLYRRNISCTFDGSTVMYFLSSGNWNIQHEWFLNTENDWNGLVYLREAIFVSWLRGPQFQVTLDVSISFIVDTFAVGFVVSVARAFLWVHSFVIFAHFSARFQISGHFIIFNHIPRVFTVSSSESLDNI